MAIISDWGAANANCYISHTAANSFISTAIIDSDAWASATPQKQGAALLEATRDIDSRQYLGGPYFREQNLEFPRAIPAGFPWNYTEVSSMLYTVEQRKMKQDVEEATCHQALWLLRMRGRHIHADMQAQGIKAWSKSTGPLSDSYEYAGNGKGALNALCPEANRLLQDWMTGRRVVRQ